MNGTATIETCSGTVTTFDTVLYVLDSTCPAGTELSCNNDTVACDTAAGPDIGSSLSLPYTSGTTYYIVVDGFDGANGDFQLTVTP